MMTFLRGRGKQALLLSVAAISVAGCSARGGVPHVDKMSPMEASTVQSNVARGLDNSRPAVRRVKLSGDFFALKPMGGEIPKSIADARVRIDFGGQTPTFDDLTMLLEDRGLSVVLGWDDGTLGSGSGASVASVEVSNTSNEGAVETASQTNTSQSVRSGSAAYNIRSRSLPFRRFEGTLGGLFRQLERSMGVTIWWDEGIYVSPVGRYSVMLPQNRELMGQVATELEAKGATNVVASIQAGTVSFVAPGALAERVIRPYLLRLGRNAAEVTMQVALVSVTMNEDSARGFDWSQFNLTFGDPYSTTGSSESGSGGSDGGQDRLGGDYSGGSAGGAQGLPTDGLFSFGSESLRYFSPAVKLLGDRRPLDIVGAIKFLSTYGETAVDQNVELRTLAGTAVNWRSGETIPYVSGVSATTGFQNGNSGGGFAGGAVGAAQTETLETGLTLDLAPNYEANGGLVTVAFELELTELVEMVELNAGNQLGTFTQPRTREQKLDDIVRIPVGETVVLGGLRRQVSSTNRNGPLSLYSIGSKNKRSETQTVFIIMRPSVTVYEVEGLTHSLPAQIGDISVNADGSAWEPQPGDYRGTNMFGASADTPGPERRRSMAQPEKSNDD